MGNAWPWLAVAGMGALHGVHPAAGWIFAGGWGARGRHDRPVLRALVPIAVGHVASVAAVAGAVVLGLSIGRGAMQGAAAALLALVAIVHVLRGRALRHRCSAPIGHAALALWSFIVSTAHGAGLMLVPALIPLCLSNGPVREITASGSLLLALAALTVHAASMLAVAALMALGARRAVGAALRVLHTRRMASRPG